MAPLAPACLPASKPSYVYMSRRQTEQLAVLTNNIASMQTNMQKQISELKAIATQTTKWVQDQQARSNEIDKTLAELRANVVALQSASVSSVETKSASFVWPLPKIAGPTSSGSNRRPSQTPGEGPGSPVISQPLGSPAQNAHPEWYQQDFQFSRSAVLFRFPCGQNKDTVKKFCDVSFPGVEDNYEIKCKKGSDNARLVFCNLKQRVSNSVLRIRVKASLCTTENPLAVRMPAEVFVLQARAYEERQMGKLLAPLWGAVNKLITNRFQCTEGIQAAPVVARKNARVCIVDKAFWVLDSHVRGCRGA